MRFPLGPGPYRDRLLDAMASLLVDLHRAGVFWGDCSLANTLFRRDGDKIQAYPRRRRDERDPSRRCPTASARTTSTSSSRTSAFGLADLGAMQGRADAFDDAVEAAEIVRARYAALWDELHFEPELSPDDRHAVRARIRRLNDLGFAVDEISLEPTLGRRGGPPAGGGRQPPVPRPRARAPDRPRRARGPGAAPAQRPARVPGLARAHAAAARSRPRRRPSAGCATSSSRAWRSWPRPSARPATRSRRTATCSRRSGSCPRRPARTSGSSVALPAYLDLGAPAPEEPGADGDHRARHRLVRRVRQRPRSRRPTVCGAPA